MELVIYLLEICIHLFVYMIKVLKNQKHIKLYTLFYLLDIKLKNNSSPLHKSYLVS
jgi:hypothetical protein